MVGSGCTERMQRILEHSREWRLGVRVHEQMWVAVMDGSPRALALPADPIMTMWWGARGIHHQPFADRKFKRQYHSS